jgi:DhnA family fructose-bisphosphate aldolase class Ia
MLVNRMRRLQGGRAHYSLLALDHGLTFGRTGDSVPLPLNPLLDQCSNHISAFVTTYGVGRTLINWPHNLSLVLQCFGAPEGLSRRLVATVEQAVLLDAAAVSVQLNLSDIDFGARLREISTFTADAHSVGMPVLFMVGGRSTASELHRTIRVCQEMGADLIKVHCSIDKFACINNDVKSAIREGPPVLLAGGVVRDDIFELARSAVQLGFSGYCIGRNIFNSNSPSQVVAQLEMIFSRTIEGAQT